MQGLKIEGIALRRWAGDTLVELCLTGLSIEQTERIADALANSQKDAAREFVALLEKASLADGETDE